MHEISARLCIARRMAIEPALSVPKQLLDLVVPNPVMLVIIENRNRTYRCVSRSLNGMFARSVTVTTCSDRGPACSRRVVTGRFDRVAERLEQRPGRTLRRLAGSTRVLPRAQLGGRQFRFSARIGRPAAE